MAAALSPAAAASVHDPQDDRRVTDDLDKFRFNGP